MRALVVSLLILSRVAAADPLVARVARVAPEPAVVIVPLRAGATPLERWRAPQPAVLPAGEALVLEIRLAQANQPDVVSVTDARRDRGIVVRIDNRRFDGPMTKNIVWVPIVEVELGKLPAGSYDVAIDERVLSWDKDATRAKPVGHGLDMRGSFTVR